MPWPKRLPGCIAWVAPCFEIIDCHVEDWKFKAVEAEIFVRALGQCSVTR